MAELRHSSSVGSRATSSPMKRDSDPAAVSQPLVSERKAPGGGGGEPRDDDPPSPSRGGKYPGKYRELYSQTAYKKLLFFFFALAALLAFVFVPSLWYQLNVPYLCVKDGLVLHCPRAKEVPSLWENPYSATTSWKPCAERLINRVSELPPENETTGYILIHAEGGLNQQRISIINAVAVAKIMNATLILPILKQDQIWKDQTKFEDIFDVDHFINYLKDDVHIVRDIPPGLPDKAEIVSSIRF